jgi:hypothetical protein
MSRKPLSLLLIILAMVTLAVAYKIQERTTDINNEMTRYALFLPSLSAQLNDITRITIQRPNEQVTLQKHKDGIWKVQEKYNYPVNMQLLRKMLLYLSQSELRSKKTSDPLRFDRIGLDGVSGKQVRLWKEEEVLHDIVLGALTSDGTATYVRQSNENQAYTASGELQFHANPTDWVDYRFFSIDPSRVQKIDFAFNGKKPYFYERNTPDATLAFAPLDKGLRLQTRIRDKDASLFFERLNFTDLLPSSKKTTNTQDVTTLTTFDGLVVKFTFHTIDYLPYAEIHAQVDTTIRDRFSSLSLSPLAEVEQEATQINALTEGWLYQLGQFQQDNLRRSYLDMTEPVVDK